MENQLPRQSEPDGVHASLVRKLDPRRFTAMSGRMAAIVGYVLGESFTETEVESLSITSDGFVVTMGDFIGSAEDLERNVQNLLAVAELTEEERAEWGRLYRAKVEDWRRGREKGDARRCIDCEHCEIEDGGYICREGGVTEIGDPLRELTEEDCNAFSAKAADKVV